MSKKASTAKAVAFPVFDGKETMTQFIRRAKLYELEHKKGKYNIIVDFLNDFLKPYNIKISSLLEFKNISYNKITEEPSHNKKILKKYGKKLVKELSIEFNAPFSEDNTEELDEDEIIKMLRCMLITIDYSLSKRTSDTDTYYTIKHTS